MIPIYKPYLGAYKEFAYDAIDSEWISNHGKYISMGTETLAKIIGVNHCILMNNGTSATHCLFKALKFKYPYINKIYVPNNVFVAAWNCALKEYDSSSIEVMKTNIHTFNIDTSEEYIKTLNYQSAVLIVHNLGKIVNIPRLKSLRPDLIFIEDNCEGMFGTYNGVKTSSSNDVFCSSTSFYGNKTITTGEGGAFFTNDTDVYEYVKKFYSHGMSKDRYVHDIEGTNYRMTNIQASLLYGQLLDIDTILTLKHCIFTNYYKLLENNYECICTEADTTEAPWIFSVYIPNIQYSKLEKHMLEKGVEIRPTFYDVHVHSHLRSLKKHENVELPTAVMLPSYPELTYDEQVFIVSCLKTFVSP